MTAPRNRSAVDELTSAISALHMEPEPLPGPFPEDEPAFLVYRDKWVSHAVEHIRAALTLIETTGKG
jgi:hypothetical protein